MPPSRVELDTPGVAADVMGQGVRMAREIPEVVRAAAGLAATVVDEARKLPETLPGLPVRVIGMAMQHAMKVQQQYAGLVARGDELFTGLRGENEPGLATFDDEEPLPQTTGFRDSAFDRAGDAASTADLITDDDVVSEQAPDTDAILDEIAIDELVDQAPTLEETAPTAAPAATAKKAAKRAAKPAKTATPAEAAETATPAEAAEPSKAAPTAESPEGETTGDVATTVDVLTPGGEISTVEATVTDEGVAAPETSADAEPAPTEDAPVSRNDAATATATDEGGTPVATVGETGAPPADEPQGGSDLAGSQAAGAAPVDGYDSFTVPQLRGRLRGYTLGTVEELIAYEQATRARAPYLTMLRNRLEKLEEKAVESSPLAPRGA